MASIQSKNRRQIVLIFGCARSGTSVLGELLASHPAVDYIFEAHNAWEMAGPGVNDGHRMTMHHSRSETDEAIRSEILSRGSHGRVLVEKNPRNSLRIPFITHLFPEAKLLHIIRDGRDVACSMVPGCGGAHWNHLKPPSWQEFFQKDRGVIRCARVWKEVVEIALRDLKVVPHLEIRYEDLIQVPTEIARTVIHFVGVPFTEELENFCRKIQNRTGDSYQARHQVHWFVPDHSVRVGRWKENMSSAEQTAVGALLEPTLRRLHYT